MSLTNKILTGALIGGGVIAGYSYYLKMRRTEAQLQIVPDAGISTSGFPLLNQVAPPSAETSNERGGVINTLDVRLIPETKKFCVAEGAPTV